MQAVKCIIFMLIFLLYGCGSTPINLAPNQQITSLNALQDLSAPKLSATAKKDSSHLRHSALAETAMTLGAQGGLAFRAGNINKNLNQYAATLDRVFNFQPMLLSHNVLPPVLSEARDTVHMAQDDAIRIADRTFKVLKQAKFVTHLPNWRDYLQLPHQAPESPDKALLPKDKQEKILWKNKIAQGWRHGIQQADLIFSDNLARLQRDMQGMILYQKMLSQNMVSQPFIAKTQLGVTGDEREVRVNDTVLRIAALPELNLKSHQWRPALRS